MSNNVEENTKTKPVLCWRCGRVIYEDPRGHMGCLNTKCFGYLSGAKRYDKEQLKQVWR